MNGIVHTFETTSSGNTGLTGPGPSPTSATTVPRLKLSPDSALQSRPRMEHLTAPNNQWKRILLSRICLVCHPRTIDHSARNCFTVTVDVF